MHDILQCEEANEPTVISLAVPGLDTLQPPSGSDAADDCDHDTKLNDFLSKGCGCARECTKLFSRDMIKQSMLDCIDLDGYCNEHINHQHVLLLGAMNALVHNQAETIQKSHKPKPRVESRSTYMFRGVSVCRNFFSVVFGCGKKKLKNVKKQFMSEGIIPKQHMNVHKPVALRSIEKRKNACTFRQNFAENNALVMPGRMTNYKNPDLKLLPSSMTKKYVYELYESATQTAGDEPLSLCRWYQVWNDFCRNVVVQLPRSDLCALCQHNQMCVAKMRNLGEDEKLALIQKCQEHLLVVQKERENYVKMIQTCKLQSMIPKEPGLHTSCSFVGTMHQSFDFAQQIHLPFNSQQVGAIYFLTGYKIGLFGIAMEPLGKFILYIIPEACATGKGSDVVLSLLHHYFENFAIGETDTVCHADNCCGQNKNNVLMQYACWRTCTDLHERFTVCFLPVGHTKFWPDLYFGLFKKKLRLDQAETIDDVCRIAKSACPQSNAIIPVPVGDESGNVIIPTFNWQSKFQPNMKAIPELKKYHQFSFSNTSKGTVMCKVASTAPDQDSTGFRIVPDLDKVSSNTPSVIQPDPFPYQRRKYLAEKNHTICN